MPKFIHLRCHSNYSIGEGSLRVSNLCEQAIAYDMPSVGLCDTNNLFGAREFSDKLVSKGLKPLIGFQIDSIYLYKGKHLIEGQILLFCKNNDGYKNLLKIHDKAYQYKSNNSLDSAKIPFEEVLKHSKDLIFLTAGVEGLLAKLFNHFNKEELDNFIIQLKQYFNKDLYIELTRLGLKNEEELEEKFLNIAKNHNVGIVATNNVLFKNIEDYDANDILICIGQGAKRDSDDRRKISPQQYFKSQDEMVKLFEDLPEAIANSVNIAKKCNYFVNKNSLSLPKFSDDEKSLIKLQSEEGLKQRLESEVYPRLLSENDIAEITKEYYDRLYFELEVIINMEFSGYFLIVSDFIKWAKENNIPVGPGRGSGAGSLVAWCLFITDVNPMQFNLLFERFLNPERVSMPDFDIDFCQDRRDDVVEYVRQKYGVDKVAHIITFGTLQARAAIKDVGRAMGISYGEVDMISKKIPYSPPSNPITLSKIVNDVEPLKEEMNNKEHVKELFDVSLKLEGLYRNTSTHAAGVVIAKESLNDIVPLFYDSGSSFPSVGFSMKYIEDLGLVKFDFLALRTLTIIQGALNLIKATKNEDVNILQIKYQDEKISELIGSGKTLGVFQLEGGGMTDVIKNMKPDKIEDIIAIISLYRPGPMENIPIYIDRKHGKEQVIYLHPKMQPILEETFGIMIYQEQVMEVARVIAGYTLGGADILRRAMGKKNPQEMEAQKSIFIDGAKATNNIEEELATEIFEQMEKFAGYGFNKSHATAYALISWQTAYLKAYYPAEFLAASMTSDINSNGKEIERFLEFLEDAKKFDIKLLPPSINHSTEVFSIEKDSDKKQAIRYSLVAIKGVGTNLVQEIRKEREKFGSFSSLEDFLSRINNKLINRRQLESLIKAGAFDEVYNNRQELVQNIDNLVNFNNNVFESKNSDQISLFGSLDETVSNILNIIPHQDYSSQEKMIEELEVMGCFLSGHPLNECLNILDKIDIKTYSEVIEKRLSSAYIAGFVMKIKLAKSKNGANFANLTLYDKASVFSVSLFGDIYNKLLGNAPLIFEGKNYIIKTNTKISDDDIRLFIESMEEITPDYKVKKSQKKTNVLDNEQQNDYDGLVSDRQEIKKEKHNIIITIKNNKDINWLANLLQDETGEDIVIIKIPCDGEVLIFEIKEITINYSYIEYNKDKIDIEIG